MKDPTHFFPEGFEDKYPYTIMYMRKYGMVNSSPYCFGSKSDWPEREKLFKRCIEQGVRWEEILGPYDGTKIY